MACLCDGPFLITKQSGNNIVLTPIVYGLSQDDFYQMLGYGYKYLNGEGELVLIYPKTSNFDQPLVHSFNYDDQNKLRLRVVPFDVSHICKERIDLKLIGICIE
jgi:5-methylcytosine-specific restriction enzyme subunit McrC